jgi:hypothetical protein
MPVPPCPNLGTAASDSVGSGDSDDDPGQLALQFNQLRLNIQNQTVSFVLSDARHKLLLDIG